MRRTEMRTASPTRGTLGRAAAGLVATLGLVCGCSPAGDSATSGSPEAAATAFTEAMRGRDWDRLSSLMHSDALREFRDMLQPVIRHPDAGEFRRALFGNRDVETIRALPDTEFFAGFMGAMFSQTPAIGEVLEGAEMKVIGRIMEGETAHVVTRLEMSVDDIDVSKIEVMSFERDDGSWRALLTGEVSGIAAAIAASAEQLPAQGVRGPSGPGG